MNRISEILEKRKEIYSLLSSLFMGEVPREFIEDLRRGNFNLSGSADIEDGIRIMREFVMKKSSVDEVIRDIEDEYSQVILISHKAPLTKSEVMGDADYGRISLEVEEKMRRMGYRLKTGSIPPDHISAQFDFIAILIEGATKGDEDLKESLKKQEEFLESEVITWIPGVLEKLEKSAEFYMGVARFARGFLALDINVVKELKLW